jgi:hypothetical protein
MWRSSDDASPVARPDRRLSRIPTFQFKPQVHVNYSEAVLPLRDGLPKFHDYPTEFLRLRQID